LTGGGMPSRTLSVFLGRPGFINPADFIGDESRANATVSVLTPRPGFSGTVFLASQSQGQPDWIDFLNGGLNTPLPPRHSASVSAVLVIKQSDRLFAFTFGHAGRGMLAGGSYETDFGLKVVLNRVDVNQLRSIDTKNFDDIVINTRKQTSRSSQLGAFGLDVSRDMLRAVVGDPADKTYFKRIAGSEAAVFTTELEFEDLGDICAELLEAYEATEYRVNFEWVDRVKEVRDAALRQTMDDSLLAALQNNAQGAMHLAPANVVDWEEVEAFSFTGSGRTLRCTYPELTLTGYLDTLGTTRLATLTLPALQRHQVLIKYSHSPDPVPVFSVYECIVWDTQHGGQHYALMDGRWFEIEPSFATRTLAAAASLHVTGAYLLPASATQSEGEYNAAVGAAHPSYAVMDCRNIRTDDMATPVECCDLFSDQREFIHIKKRTSSATLSHLFSQGSVSAELFMSSDSFRAKLRDQLTTDLKNAHAALVPVLRPDPSQFRVIYAIIARHDHQGHPPALPFFSAVNLVQHHQRLQRLGLAVNLRYIQTA
jgi:uncharacterized protein (TIGR04141 family)